MRNSCDWPGENKLMIEYHDTEWGVPTHNIRKLFEFLLLDNAQAGPVNDHLTCCFRYTQCG